VTERVLLTGATGFIGSHVYPALVRAGLDVLCAARKPRQAAAAHPDRRWVRFDLEDGASVEAALAQVDRAIYLVHSMSAAKNYSEVEQLEAERFREAAERHGLSRIVYLGGMRPTKSISKHLESRLKTGRVLRGGAISVVELRATMVVGGGSESFRIVRDLAARMPWMLLPKWLESVSEPVAMPDVAAAIVRALCLKLEAAESRVYDVPGPERLSGRDIIMGTARLLGKKPHAWRVPLVTPRLSSYWIRLVTRADPVLATELVEGLRSDIVSSGPTIWDEMPEHRRLSFDEGVRLALADEEKSLGMGSRLMERALRRLTSA